MNNRINYIALGLCAITLTSCMNYDDRPSSEYLGYSTTYNVNPSYYQGNYRMTEYQYDAQPKKAVEVPDSYHVGAYHSPVSFKDRDREWVKGQNPQGYTIEVADDEKASQVAQKLYKAPKNDRMGQVQYQREGKAHYKGVYGSYDSPEAAQKALDALPADIKQGAGVKNWSSVQENIE